MNFNEIAAVVEDLSNRTDILEIRIKTMENACKASAAKTTEENAK